MTSISSRNLVDAVLRFEQMTFQDRERLVEELHARQPNLLFSVFVLQRYGATLEQIEVVLNLLLCQHQSLAIAQCAICNAKWMEFESIGHRFGPAGGFGAHFWRTHAQYLRAR